MDTANQYPPLPQKKRAVFHHPMGFELYDGLAMDMHAMAFAEPLLKEIDRLRAERDEADRRAGAAERSLADARDSIGRRQSWLSKAKREWGVSDNVSFDVVWAEALKLKAEVAALREAVGAATEFIGTVAGGASWWDDVWSAHETAIDNARKA